MTNIESRSALSALIARLEKATGPDRELDRAIWEVVVADEKQYRRNPLPEGRRYSEWESKDRHGNWNDFYPGMNVKHYAESFDAAVTLLPYQREWHVGSVTLLGEFWAEVITPTGRYVGKGAKTPAIALCIAALKARIDQEERSEKSTPQSELPGSPSPSQEGK